MLGINLEFEKNVPFPLGRKPVMKDRPATVKDLICLWVEQEGEVGDSFKIQGNKLKSNVCQHFNYKTTPDGYRFRLSYRTVFFYVRATSPLYPIYHLAVYPNDIFL